MFMALIKMINIIKRINTNRILQQHTKFQHNSMATLRFQGFNCNFLPFPLIIVTNTTYDDSLKLF